MNENSRPTLNDPTEWALIRDMYFDNNSPLIKENNDPLEELERLESRIRNNNISSR